MTPRQLKQREAELRCEGWQLMSPRLGHGSKLWLCLLLVTMAIAVTGIVSLAATGDLKKLVPDSLEKNVFGGLFVSLIVFGVWRSGLTPRVFGSVWATRGRVLFLGFEGESLFERAHTHADFDADAEDHRGMRRLLLGMKPNRFTIMDHDSGRPLPPGFTILTGETRTVELNARGTRRLEALWNAPPASAPTAPYSSGTQNR